MFRIGSSGSLLADPATWPSLYQRKPFPRLAGATLSIDKIDGTTTMIRILPAQRAAIEAAASTIHNSNTRDLFLRQVAKVLECCASPVAPNDVTQALRMCMMTVPSSQRLAMNGDTHGDDEEYHKDCARRY
jgi:hypothetical protein